jgi:hypothetical protein
MSEKKLKKKIVEDRSLPLTCSKKASVMRPAPRMIRAFH